MRSGAASLCATAIVGVGSTPYYRRGQCESGRAGELLVPHPCHKQRLMVVTEGSWRSLLVDADQGFRVSMQVRARAMHFRNVEVVGSSPITSTPFPQVTRRARRDMTTGWCLNRLPAMWWSVVVRAG